MTKPGLGSQSPEMKRILQMATSVATTKATILILGESGTGKEVLARHIHDSSPRNKNKFVAINCAAVPENLLESELFGFEKGSFTGAHQAKPGKFELASGGTLLLDEMSEMPLPLQAKLLRVLQEGEIERIGGAGPKKIDCRVIATSNRDLSAMVQQGRFRGDLYYRLNVVTFRLPALRDRRVDIAPLAKHFLQLSCLKNALPPKVLTEEALNLLSSAEWSGNIRELQNAIERASCLSPDSSLDSTHFKDVSGGAAPGVEGYNLEDLERKTIIRALAETGQNRTRAAELLGINVRTLRNKINIYRLQTGVIEVSE
ncbi:MAG: sigma-54 dependent transcriptional regulator [Bdellovibrionales bacterium]|nr:sigma-54 dependent transcriptional regulator [Bdellovibrionales bacterium]